MEEAKKYKEIYELYESGIPFKEISYVYNISEEDLILICENYKKILDKYGCII